MERKSYSMSHFKSKTVPDRSQTYCNAEVLLKTLKINGKFTVESVLEAIQHYIRKIDELTLQNKLMRDKLEHYRILAKSQIDTCLDTETSTDVPYLQQRINNLLKELHGHRKIEDDRIKLKSQINKMALIIKQLSQRDPDKPSNERLIAGDIAGMHADRERLKDLLDKMLGIEGKIIEFKRQAANAVQLQTEVNKLRQELQKERSKEVQKIDATVEQYRKQAQRMESELQVCKKERDLYERVTKKLEIRIKKAINDREIYEKKAEELDCKYEKALFELEKLQTKNAELLLKEPVKKDTVLKELKLALHECRGQLRCAEKLNSEYEEKVNKLSTLLLKARRQKLRASNQEYCCQQRSTHQSPTVGNFDSIENMLNELNKKLQAESDIVMETVENSVDFSGDRFIPLPFRYWRKTTAASNMILKISPQLQPPTGFERKFIIRTDVDLMNMQNILTPSDLEINEAIRKKREAETLLQNAKVEAYHLIKDVRKELGKSKGL